MLIPARARKDWLMCKSMDDKQCRCVVCDTINRVYGAQGIPLEEIEIFTTFADFYGENCDLSRVYDRLSI